MGLQSFDEVRPKKTWTLINAASGTTEIDVAYCNDKTAWRADMILATSTLAADSDLEIGFMDYVPGGSSYYPMWTITVPAGAGQGTVPVFDVLAAILPAGASGLIFGWREGLYCNAPTTLGTPGAIYLYVQGGEL